MYPSELGRIAFLSTNTGKVIVHNFMLDPIVKLISEDDNISHAIEAATLAGVTFMKYTPGEGEKELGGHYDDIRVLLDHKDDDKSTPVINVESQQGEAESQKNDVGDEQNAEPMEEEDGFSTESSERSDTASSKSRDTADSVSSGEDSAENDDGESGEDCKAVKGAESGDMSIAKVTACLYL